MSTCGFGKLFPLNENECFLPQPAISGKQMSLLKGNFENVSNVVHIFSFHSLQGVPTDKIIMARFSPQMTHKRGI